jgi:FHS family L-fucose permease-like MFS transporter
MGFFKRQTLRNRNDQKTNAADLTWRESMHPLKLVTVLFFLGASNLPSGYSSVELTTTQGFSHGLIVILAKHFQDTVGVSRSLSSWLYIAYFGAYPLASLGHANWILRHWGYKATFIWGLTLSAVGSFIAWPCLKSRSFGGFCGAAFVLGNGLGALETAANPYLVGMLR